MKFKAALKDDNYLLLVIQSLEKLLEGNKEKKKIFLDFGINVCRVIVKGSDEDIIDRVTCFAIVPTVFVFESFRLEFKKSENKESLIIKCKPGILIKALESVNDGETSTIELKKINGTIYLHFTIGIRQSGTSNKLTMSQDVPVRIQKDYSKFQQPVLTEKQVLKQITLPVIQKLKVSMSRIQKLHDTLNICVHDTIVEIKARTTSVSVETTFVGLSQSKEIYGSVVGDQKKRIELEDDDDDDDDEPMTGSQLGEIFVRENRKPRNYVQKYESKVRTADFIKTINYPVSDSGISVILLCDSFVMLYAQPWMGISLNYYIPTLRSGDEYEDDDDDDEDMSD